MSDAAEKSSADRLARARKEIAEENLLGPDFPHESGNLYEALIAERARCLELSERAEKAEKALALKELPDFGFREELRSELIRQGLEDGEKLAAAESRIAELTQQLKNACDRDWKDETPEQVVAIAANAIYWRGFDKEKLVERLRNLLPNVCQLLDGWHADGTAWSEWDESIRKEVGALLQEVQ